MFIYRKRKGIEWRVRVLNLDFFVVLNLESWKHYTQLYNKIKILKAILKIKSKQTAN